MWDEKVAEEGWRRRGQAGEEEIWLPRESESSGENGGEEGGREKEGWRVAMMDALLSFRAP